MKAIMISVKPEWCRKILSREKTIEIRKTMPKCDLPVKVYIYCTKCKDTKRYTDEADIPLETEMYMGNGRVIAEFTLNNVTKHEKNFIDAEDNLLYNFLTEDVIKIGFNNDLDGLCDFDSFVEDYGKGKPLYAWHIDDLKIYDKPKELSKFSTTLHRMKGKQSRYTSHLLQRPPQSWCHVEELKGE